MTDQQQYHAFISYSHRDARQAAWLHKKIETYTDHRQLRNRQQVAERAFPEKLFPVFRDRDELEGVADLPARINAALANSRALLVVCSPHAATSRWVNEEIRTFKSINPQRPVLAYVVDGEPGSGDTQECYPPALRFQLDADGSISDRPAEPGAADARPGKDGRRNALLKILAALLDVRFDQLRQRDQERRRRRLLALTAFFAVLASILVVLAGLAWYQRGEAIRARNEAQKNADEARRQSQLASRQARIAGSRQLAAMALNEMPGREGDPFDLPRGLLLAALAQQTEPMPATYAALLKLLNVAPYRIQFFHGHEGAVRDLAFDASGDKLVSAGADGRALVWDSGSGDRLGAIDYGAQLFTLDLHGASGLLALGGYGGAVQLWDLATLAMPRKSLQTGQRAVAALSFSPDGRQLAMASGGNSVSLWDTTTATEIDVLEGDPGASVDALAFSPSGDYLAAAGDNGYLTLWSGAPGRWQSTPLQGHEKSAVGGVSAVAFAVDESLLVSAGGGGAIRISYLGPNSPKGVSFPALNSAVHSVAMAPDGKTLASGDKHGGIRFWTSERIPELLQVNGAAVLANTYSRDGRRFASAGARGRLVVWQLDRAPLGEPFARDIQWASALSLDPIDGVIDSLQQRLLRDTGVGQPVAATRIDRHTFKAVGLSANRQYIALATWSNQILVLNLQALDEPTRVFDQTITSRALHISDSGSELSFVDDCHLQTFHINTKSLVASHDLSAPGGKQLGCYINVAHFNPDGSSLLFSPRSGHVALVDRLTGKVLGGEMQGDPESVIELKFAHRGGHFFSTGNRGAVNLWRIGAQGLQPTRLRYQGKHLSAVTFSPDGGLLLAATTDSQGGAARIVQWDTRSGMPLGEPLQATVSAITLAVSPDGRRLAIEGENTVELWDLATRRPLGELQVKREKREFGLSFSADGDALYTTRGEPTVWNLTPEFLIERACQVANRNLSVGEWREVMAEDVPYRPVCSSLPRPPSPDADQTGERGLP